MKKIFLTIITLITIMLAAIVFINRNDDVIEPPILDDEQFNIKINLGTGLFYTQIPLEFHQGTYVISVKEGTLIVDNLKPYLTYGNVISNGEDTFSHWEIIIDDNTKYLGNINILENDFFSELKMPNHDIFIIAHWVVYNAPLININVEGNSIGSDNNQPFDDNFFDNIQVFFKNESLIRQEIKALIKEAEMLYSDFDIIIELQENFVVVSINRVIRDIYKVTGSAIDFEYHLENLTENNLRNDIGNQFFRDLTSSNLEILVRSWIGSNELGLNLEENYFEVIVYINENELIEITINRLLDNRYIIVVGSAVDTYIVHLNNITQDALREYLRSLLYLDNQFEILEISNLVAQWLVNNGLAYSHFNVEISLSNTININIDRIRISYIEIQGDNQLELENLHTYNLIQEKLLLRYLDQEKGDIEVEVSYILTTQLSNLTFQIIFVEIVINPNPKIIVVIDQIHNITISFFTGSGNDISTLPNIIVDFDETIMSVLERHFITPSINLSNVEFLEWRLTSITGMPVIVDTPISVEGTIVLNLFAIWVVEENITANIISGEFASNETVTLMQSETQFHNLSDLNLQIIQPSTENFVAAVSSVPGVTFAHLSISEDVMTEALVITYEDLFQETIQRFVIWQTNEITMSIITGAFGEDVEAYQLVAAGNFHVRTDLQIIQPSTEYFVASVNLVSGVTFAHLSIGENVMTEASAITHEDLFQGPIQRFVIWQTNEITMSIITGAFGEDVVTHQLVESGNFHVRTDLQIIQPSTEYFVAAVSSVPGVTFAHLSTGENVMTEASAITHEDLFQGPIQRFVIWQTNEITMSIITGAFGEDVVTHQLVESGNFHVRTDLQIIQPSTEYFVAAVSSVPGVTFAHLSTGENVMTEASSITHEDLFQGPIQRFAIWQTSEITMSIIAGAFGEDVEDHQLVAAGNFHVREDLQITQPNTENFVVAVSLVPEVTFAHLSITENVMIDASSITHEDLFQGPIQRFVIWQIVSSINITIDEGQGTVTGNRVLVDAETQFHVLDDILSLARNAFDVLNTSDSINGYNTIETGVFSGFTIDVIDRTIFTRDNITSNNIFNLPTLHALWEELFAIIYFDLNNGTWDGQVEPFIQLSLGDNILDAISQIIPLRDFFGFFKWLLPSERSHYVTVSDLNNTITVTAIWHIIVDLNIDIDVLIEVNQHQVLFLEENSLDDIKQYIENNLLNFLSYNNNTHIFYQIILIGGNITTGNIVLTLYMQRHSINVSFNSSFANIEIASIYIKIDLNRYLLAAIIDQHGEDIATLENVGQWHFSHWYNFNSLVSGIVDYNKILPNNDIVLTAIFNFVQDSVEEISGMIIIHSNYEIFNGQSTIYFDNLNLTTDIRDFLLSLRNAMNGLDGNINRVFLDITFEIVQGMELLGFYLATNRHVNFLHTTSILSFDETGQLIIYAIVQTYTNRDNFYWISTLNGFQVGILTSTLSVVHIPSFHEGQKVTSLYSTFSQRGIQSLRLPKYLVEIPEYAFYDNPLNTKIAPIDLANMPNLRRINTNAFGGSSSELGFRIHINAVTSSLTYIATNSFGNMGNNYIVMLDSWTYRPIWWSLRNNFNANNNFVDVNNDNVYNYFSELPTGLVVSTQMTTRGDEVNNGGGNRLPNSDLYLHGQRIDRAFWMHQPQGINERQFFEITLKQRSHVVIYIGRAMFGSGLATIGVWQNQTIEELSQLTILEQDHIDRRTQIPARANIDKAIAGFNEGPLDESQAGIGRTIVTLDAGTHTIGRAFLDRRILMMMIFEYDPNFIIEDHTIIDRPLTANPEWYIHVAPTLPSRENLRTLLTFDADPGPNFTFINPRVIYTYGFALNNIVFDPPRL